MTWSINVKILLYEEKGNAIDKKFDHDNRNMMLFVSVHSTFIFICICTSQALVFFTDAMWWCNLVPIWTERYSTHEPLKLFLTPSHILGKTLWVHNIKNSLCSCRHLHTAPVQNISSSSWKETPLHNWSLVCKISKKWQLSPSAIF